MTNVRQIIINSPKYGQKICLVDEEDFELVSKYRWRVSHPHRTGWYAITNLKTNKNKPTKMHRMIMGFPDYRIDHADGNGFNNTKKNLRKCTNSQNAANRGAGKNNTVGYKGVHYLGTAVHSKRKKKWIASIKVNYRNIHLGYFDSAKDGAIAYNKAAVNYFGEFAHLNHI